MLSYVCKVRSDSPGWFPRLIIFCLSGIQKKAVKIVNLNSFINPLYIFNCLYCQKKKKRKESIIWCVDLFIQTGKFFALGFSTVQVGHIRTETLFWVNILYFCQHCAKCCPWVIVRMRLACKTDTHSALIK